jgi:hypothetical protein
VLVAKKARVRQDLQDYQDLLFSWLINETEKNRLVIYLFTAHSSSTSLRVVRGAGGVENHPPEDLLG